MPSEDDVEVVGVGESDHLRFPSRLLGENLEGLLVERSDFLHCEEVVGKFNAHPVEAVTWLALEPGAPTTEKDRVRLHKLLDSSVELTGQLMVSFEFLSALGATELPLASFANDVVRFYDIFTGTEGQRLFERFESRILFGTYGRGRLRCVFEGRHGLDVRHCFGRHGGGVEGGGKYKERRELRIKYMVGEEGNWIGGRVSSYPLKTPSSVLSEGEPYLEIRKTRDRMKLFCSAN